MEAFDAPGTTGRKRSRHEDRLASFQPTGPQLKKANSGQTTQDFLGLWEELATDDDLSDSSSCCSTGKEILLMEFMRSLEREIMASSPSQSSSDCESSIGFDAQNHSSCSFTTYNLSPPDCDTEEGFGESMSDTAACLPDDLEADKLERFPDPWKYSGGSVPNCGIDSTERVWGETLRDCQAWSVGLGCAGQSDHHFRFCSSS